MSKTFVINLGSGIETVDHSGNPIGYKETTNEAVLKGYFNAAIPDEGDRYANPALFLDANELKKFFIEVADKTESAFQGFNLEPVTVGGKLYAVVSATFRGA